MKAIQHTTITVCLFSATALMLSSTAVSAASNWPFAGGDVQNSRNAGQNGPSVGQMASARVNWIFTGAGEFSATPTSDGTSLYVPDWGGYLYQIDSQSGRATWSHKVSEYTSNANSVSRTSPALSGNTLVIGDQAAATVLAIQKTTGKLIWKNTVDLQAYSFITSSPVIVGNLIYIGISSSEESHAGTSGFSFRGSVVALDLTSGRVVWQTYTVPSGYTGGSVWGSTPAVDVNRQTVFVGTGNNYSIPDSAASCLVKNGNNAAAEKMCLNSEDYFDSVLALDMRTGAVKWAERLEPSSDTWNDNCIPGRPGSGPCPVPQGRDDDFGSGPNLFTVGSGRNEMDLVGIGQKSGVYWALDPDSGAIVWSTKVGPGGMLGGIEWGSASDGNRVYVAITNFDHLTYTLTPSGAKHNGGSWAALDARTGKILWQVKASGTDPQNSALPAQAQGAMTVSNGVVYAGSMSGDMVALNASNGATVASINSGGSVVGGPCIVNGSMYWGSGYGPNHNGVGRTNNRLFAFSGGRD